MYCHGSGLDFATLLAAETTAADSGSGNNLETSTATRFAFVHQILPFLPRTSAVYASVLWGYDDRQVLDDAVHHLRLENRFLIYQK